ncbi:MAG TPA: hypothetical protein VNC11_05610, partial [Gemmatimonadaceae bacterium]|nr:hypothetical protein [Gemmatimonadaceae bacterium]
FSHAAALYGATYHLASDTDSLRSGVTAGIEGKGLHIVELRTDRARNVTLHREAVSAVAKALDEHWH